MIDVVGQFSSYRDMFMFVVQFIIDGDRSSKVFLVSRKRNELVIGVCDDVASSLCSFTGKMLFLV